MLKMVQPNFNLKKKRTLYHHDDRAFFETKEFHSQHLFPCGCLL